MSNETIQNMHRVLELQKSLNIKEGAPSLELRSDRLDRVVAMVTKYKSETISALQDDFGNRDPVMSAATEVDSVVDKLSKTPVAPEVPPVIFSPVVNA